MSRCIVRVKAVVSLLCDPNALRSEALAKDTRDRVRNLCILSVRLALARLSAATQKAVVRRDDPDGNRRIDVGLSKLDDPTDVRRCVRAGQKRHVVGCRVKYLCDFLRARGQWIRTKDFDDPSDTTVGGRHAQPFTDAFDGA